jgi:hypothetical protein
LVDTELRGRWLAMSQLRGLMIIVILSTVLSWFGPDVAAQQSTPATMEATGVADETLFSWTIAAVELPTGDIESVFYRLTLPASASLPLLAGPFCG